MIQEQLLTGIWTPLLSFFNNGHFVKNAKLAYEIMELVKSKINNIELVEVKDVNQDLLVNYYNAADVLLLVSLHEGSNNSLKEAISCNCPVVSLNVGDAKKQLSGVDNSYIHDFVNISEIANSIIQIIESKKKSNGRRKIGEVEMSKVAKRISIFYESLI